MAFALSPCKFTSCRLLYATQSGRAKACARRLQRLLQEHTVLTIHAPQAFDQVGGLPFLQQHGNDSTVWILFVSTTGDGEQTDAIRRTWQQLLQKCLPADLLAGLHFAMFCLGDRAYGPQFCAAGRKLAARLLQLGAHLLPDHNGMMGYGDDGTAGGGVWIDLDQWWTAALLPQLRRLDGVCRDKILEASVPPAILYHVEQRQQQHSAVSSVNTDNPQGIDSPDYDAILTEFVTQVAPVTAYCYTNQLRRCRDVTSPSCLTGVVASNDRLTAPEWEQDVRHVRIRVSHNSTMRSSNSDTGSNSTDIVGDDGDGAPYHSNLPYRAGDVAVILPSNSAGAVQRFLDVVPAFCRNAADEILVLQQPPGALPLATSILWPATCTLRHWLTYCADICALPEREDLRALSHFCSMTHPLGQQQRDKLVALSETSGAALYNDYILREKRSWADVLFDFDSLRHDDSRLALDVLFSLLNPIRPREFSIASSPSWLALQVNGRMLTGEPIKNPGFDIELCVAVVKGTTPLGRTYHGLCSTFLAATTPGKSSLCLWIRPGSFGGLPLELNAESHAFEKQVLYIGAGTGVAPLRGLIFERQAAMLAATTATTSLQRHRTDDTLVFGCRKEACDYLYQSEWNSLQRDGALQVVSAFSQDQWHKVYVQQKLRNLELDKKNTVAGLILQGEVAIYIAGNPRMARAVKQELVELLAAFASCAEKNAVQILGQMQRQGLFSVEAWS